MINYLGGVHVHKVLQRKLVVSLVDTSGMQHVCVGKVKALMACYLYIQLQGGTYKTCSSIGQMI